MKVARTIAELREALPPGSIGLVPTMGAYHEGHLSLFRAAREECDVVVVSLSLNGADGLRLCSQVRSLDRVGQSKPNSWGWPVIS